MWTPEWEKILALATPTYDPHTSGLRGGHGDAGKGAVGDEASEEIPVGALHRILAQDQRLSISLLCGLREWKACRVAADVWATSKGYRPSQWAKRSGVGFIGGLDGDLWEWVRGGQKNRRGGVHRHVHIETPPPRPPPNATPPPLEKHQTKPPPPPKRTNSKFYFKSAEDSSDGAIPWGGTKKQKTHHPKAETKATPAPKVRAHTPLSPPPPPAKPATPTPQVGDNLRTQSLGPSPTSPTPQGGGGGNGHSSRCPSQQGWCCVGEIPRQHHPLRGGPRPPLHLPRRS